jgi:hypothetical protein
VASHGLVEELWREQSLWSQTANRMKRHIDRARLAALVLVVLVAVAGTVAAELSDLAPVVARVLAVIAAAGALVLPRLRPLWSGTALRDWTRTRSVSEALKSDVYLWLAGAPPYQGDVDAVVLRDRTDKLRADAADLHSKRAGITAAQRALPAVHDLPSFFTVRIADQIDKYYMLKAAERLSRLKMFRRIEIGLGFVGAALGVLAATLGTSLTSWIAVVATIGTALAVHVSAGRYEFQLIEFERTAERLRQLHSRATAGAGPAVLARLAVQAEEVISVENQGWMAKLAETPPDYEVPDAAK